jgi:hypothetical protein
MDYESYGRAELSLSWLDENVQLETAPGGAKQVLENLIRAILAGIQRRGRQGGSPEVLGALWGSAQKISFSYEEEPGWEKRLPEGGTGRVALLVNARVETPRRGAAAGVPAALAGCGAAYREADISCFRPERPSPLTT